MPNAGALSEKIAFDSVVSTPSPGGGQTNGFAEQFVVSASRDFMRGSETVQAARRQGRQPVMLTVRRSSQTEQITTDWRARDARSGVEYQILAVEPSKDRAWITVHAEAGVAI